jgi:hypothetical protein
MRFFLQVCAEPYRTLHLNVISYLFQMTENSTSNSEDKARCKLLSTQSEPAAPTKNNTNGCNDSILILDEGIDDAAAAALVSSLRESLENGGGGGNGSIRYNIFTMSN